jgi:hypothetical protein
MADGRGGSSVMSNIALTFTLPPRHKTYTSGNPDFRHRGGLAAA